MKHDQIHTYIKGMLAQLGFTEADVTVSYDEKMNTIWFSITSPHTRLLSNRDGEALTALNHLATKVVEQIMREETVRPRVVIDANNVEKKKIDNLKTIAHMMAERARYFKSSVDLDPMPPHERRIIHEFLGEVPDVYTESAGDGMKRHIVIRYRDTRT